MKIRMKEKKMKVMKMEEMKMNIIMRHKFNMKGGLNMLIHASVLKKENRTEKETETEILKVKM